MARRLSMAGKKRTSTGDTTVRVPNSILARADKVTLMAKEVQEHEFFSSIGLVSNGFTRSSILKWAIDLGLRQLVQEHARAVQELQQKKERTRRLEKMVDKIQRMRNQKGGKP